MDGVGLPIPALPGLRLRELGEADAPLVQAFYEANPAYFVAVSGRPAQPGEGLSDLQDLPPPGFTWTRRWYVGWTDESDRLAAVADVTSDLPAASVWHVGLFIVETKRHGSGDARVLYGAIEAWARRGGASWMRLGVVKGNSRAEAFWMRQGFVQLRMREGVDFGNGVTHDVRVMSKALDGGSIESYLALVVRDRIESP